MKEKCVRKQARPLEAEVKWRVAGGGWGEMERNRRVERCGEVTYRAVIRHGGRHLRSVQPVGSYLYLCGRV
jgi:hypothetical protein